MDETRKFSIHAADAASAAATFHAPPKPLPLPPGMTISQLPSRLRPVSKKGNSFKKSFGPGNAEPGNPQHAPESNTMERDKQKPVALITIKETKDEQVSRSISGVKTGYSIPSHTTDALSPNIPACIDRFVQDRKCSEVQDEEKVEAEKQLSIAPIVREQEEVIAESRLSNASCVKADIQPTIDSIGSNIESTEDENRQSIVEPTIASPDEDPSTSLHSVQATDPENESFTWDDDEVPETTADEAERLAKMGSEQSRALWVCRPGGDLGMEEVIGKTPAEIDTMLVGTLHGLLPDVELLKIECDELFHATKGEEPKMGAEDLYDVTQRLIDRFGSRDEAVLDRIGLIYTTVAAAFENSDGMSAVEFRGYVASVLTQILHELESRGQKTSNLSPEAPDTRSAPPESEEFSQNPLVMLTKALHRVGLATTDIAKAFVGLTPEEQQHDTRNDIILESSLF